MPKSLDLRLAVILATFTGILLLSGCEKAEVDVALHGVNYSGEEFRYSVADPSVPNRSFGGQHVGPFEAGGIVCCAKLPKEWSPGIKIEIHTTYWTVNRLAGRPTESRKTHIVEVPKYIDGKPGELWVLRGADGRISVVSSDFQPDHPQWPGKIKGWPEPSVEYKRERWEILKKHHEIFVRNSIALLSDLRKNPAAEAKDAWEFSQKNDPPSIEGFRGPDDPKYIETLRRRYEDAVQESQEELKKVMEEEP